MTTCVQDIRYALRGLGQRPGFTAVAVLSLALGIGANTAIFSLINATLLRPAPYPEPERLLMANLLLESRDGSVEDRDHWSYPYYLEFAANSRSFENTAALYGSYLNMTGLGEAYRVKVELVSSDYFAVLGVQAQRGRTFTPEAETTPGEGNVATISDGLWKRRFGQDPGIVGNTIRLEGVPFEITGVLPGGFDGLSGDIDLWVPITMSAPLLSQDYTDNPYFFWHQVVGRLKTGTTLEAADAELRELGTALIEAFPEETRGVTPRIVPLREAQIDQAVRQPLGLLYAAVGLVLMIACANVANLLLARTASRRREIGIRLALGAGRGRLLRQFLTEGAVLGLLGGGAGLLIGVWTLRTVLPHIPDLTNSWTSSGLSTDALSLDTTVLAYSMGLALFCGLLFGIAPALISKRSDLREAIGSSAAVGAHPRRLGGAGSLTVVGQIGLALVLLVGASLMIRTLYLMRTAYPGFDGTRVLTARFQLSDARYPDGTGDFYLPLLERLRALPGAEVASLASSLPLTGSNYGAYLTIQEQDEDIEDYSAQRRVRMHIVEDSFFDILQIPLLEGRVFGQTERPGTPDKALINRAAAALYWPGRSPLGKMIAFSLGRGGRSWFEVVGVVENARYRGVDQEVGPEGYISYYQTPPGSMVVYVRTAGDPQDFVATLRSAATTIDAEAPLYDVRTLADLGSASRARSRFLTVLLGSFAAVALLLAASGIYSVMAFAVALRTKEFGVRMALGATSSTLLRRVLVDAVRLAGIGSLIGLTASAFLVRFVESQLYGVSAFDPLALTATTIVLAAVALLASYLPARRAARSDPLVALRAE